MGISVDPVDNQNHPSDLALAQGGDGEAFCRLLAPLEERLVQQAFALCRDSAAAEDIAAETMVEAWKSLGRFDGSCRLGTWLYAILLHRYHKFIRRAQSRPISLAALPRAEAVEREESQGKVADPEASPAELAAQSERDDALRRLIDELPEKHREVVLLRFFEEATVPEIASALGCSEGTVKSRLHHALKKLQERRGQLNDSAAARDTER